MRRSLADGYELDDDRARIDVDLVYDFLATEAYWVPVGPETRSSA
jgi:hypothetical protein